MLYGRTKLVENSIGRWRYIITDRRGHDLFTSDQSYATKEHAKYAARRVTADPSPPAGASATTTGGTAHRE